MRWAMISIICKSFQTSHTHATHIYHENDSPHSINTHLSFFIAYFNKIFILIELKSSILAYFSVKYMGFDLFCTANRYLISELRWAIIFIICKSFMSNYVEINNAKHTPITIGMSAWVTLNVQCFRVCLHNANLLLTESMNAWADLNVRYLGCLSRLKNFTSCDRAAIKRAAFAVSVIVHFEL